jgi:8-oxo-dGTP diphosphatase
MRKVVAAIFRQGDRVFIAKRHTHGSLPGKWEFPGGKLEAGETPEQGLKREIREEFGIPIKVAGFYAESIFEHQGERMELLGYLAKMLREDITLNVHTEGKWVKIKELPAYDFPPADRIFVEKLLSEKI